MAKKKPKGQNGTALTAIAVTTPAEVVQGPKPASAMDKVEQAVTVISTEWRKHQTNYVELGKAIIKVRNSLGHGSWETVKKRLWVELGLDPRSIERVVAIAEHPVTSDPTHASDLPASWMTQYELIQLDKKFGKGTLARCVKDGQVRRATQRKDVDTLKEKLEARKQARKQARLSKAQGTVPPDQAVPDQPHSAPEPQDALLEDHSADSAAVSQDHSAAPEPLEETTSPEAAPADQEPDQEEAEEEHIRRRRAAARVTYLGYLKTRTPAERYTELTEFAVEANKLLSGVEIYVKKMEAANV
jgi:hypothetical protein